jgi:hypothetical protein
MIMIAPAAVAAFAIVQDWRPTETTDRACQLPGITRAVRAPRTAVVGRPKR